MVFTLATVKKTTIPLELLFQQSYQIPRSGVAEPYYSVNFNFEGISRLAPINKQYIKSKCWCHRGSLQQMKIQYVNQEKKIANHMSDKVLTVKIFKEPLCPGRKKITVTNTCVKNKQITQIYFSPMKRNRWSASMWKYTQSQSSGKCDSDPLWDASSQLWLSYLPAQKRIRLAEKMVQKLRVLAAFGEALGSVLSTYARRCMTAYNSRRKGLCILFWSCGYPYACLHIQT